MPEIYDCSRCPSATAAGICRVQPKILGSVISPVTAAAAATNGPARIVRAPGPWRPSKLRLLVETAYFPAGILSSFIARQAEQPGWRKVKPASSNILSKPSSRICASTIQEPGTNQAIT